MSGFSTAALSARWQRLTRRQQWVAALAIAAGAAVVVDAVALRPLRQRLARLRAEATQAEASLVEAVQAELQAEPVKHAFSAYEPWLKRERGAEAELAAVLSEVEQAARQSGMQLLNLKPVSKSEASAAERDRISVTAEAEATPAQLARLLDALQRSSRLLRVTNLTTRVSEAKTLRISMVVSRLVLP